LTGRIEYYIMIAMGSLRNKVRNKQSNTELYRLSKGFKALTINHKKGVLKMAQGLLRVQKAHKAMAATNTCEAKCY